MSNKIDERIVQMTFDNKAFERDIADSQRSLKEFDKSMGFGGAITGVNNLTASFSKMDAVIFGVIQNLTNQVLNFGKTVIKSFTLDPLLSGMNDYETKLTTMQTITNATGKSIEEVEKYFSDLDTYADKTIYNLTDMTSSMAKFVNAGVSLEKSVPAIKGIANMTALAGQGAQQASIAMYNLSQSIAGGYLTRMDFKSLELANIATIEWKQRMVDAAVAAGTLKKATNGYTTSTGKAFKMQELFIEGLQEQWASTNVMLSVLGEYGDATTDIGKKAQAAAQDVKSFSMLMDTLKEAVGTGWTRSFELIIGDLEESKQLWTGVSNAVGEFLGTLAEGRNAMLEFWHDNGGREAFLNGLKYAAIALIKVLLSVSMAFDSIFPPQTQQQFVDMFKAFENFTRSLIIGDESAEKLQRTFRGLFSVVNIVVEVVKLFGNILGQVVRTVFPGFSGGALEVTATLGDFLYILNVLIQNGSLFKNMLSGTGVFIDRFGSIAKSALYSIVGLVAGLANGSITIQDVGSSIGEFASSLKDFVSILFSGQTVSASFVRTFEKVNSSLGLSGENVEVFSNGFETAKTNVTTFISVVSRGLLPVLGWIGDALSKVSLGQIGIIALGIGLIAISKTILSVFSPIGGVMNSFSNVLDSVSGSFKSFTLSVKAEAMFTIAKSIALLTGSLIALAFVPFEKLVIGLAALTVMMAELTIGMLALNKIQNPAKIGMQLTALSAGLFVVAKAALQFESMSWSGLLKAGVSIGAFLASMVVFNKFLGNGVQMSTGLVSFSLGLMAMSAALLVFSKISFDSIAKGTGPLISILAILALYTKVVNGKDITKATAGLIGFGAGLIALTGALLILSNLPFDKLLKGSVALLSLLTVLGLYTNMVNGKSFAAASKGLVGLGVGLIAITGALAILGNLPFATLVQGSVALLALLGTLGLFIKMTNGADLSITAGSLIGLGVGIIALSAALAILGSLDFSTLLQGTGAIVTIMGAIATFVMFTNGVDLGITAGAIIAFSAGIGMLAGVIALLTLLDTGKLLAATLAIGGLITTVGLFSHLTNIAGLATSALGLGLFALALAGLSIPIKMIAEIPWQQLSATAGVIVAAVGMFALVAALMPVFAAVSALIPPALLGVLGVGAVIAEIGLLIAAFGGLSMIPGVTDIINSGGDLLTQIGLAIGGFIGGIVGGIGQGATAALPEIGRNISAFGESIAPFFASVKGVDTSGVEAVKYLAEALLILGAANVTNSLTSWLTGGSTLTVFAKELKAFAPDFVEFAQKIEAGNINATVVENTANAAKAMSAMASNLPNQGGYVAKWFTGDNTLSTFASELKAFAPDFVEFAQKINTDTINIDMVENTANAAKAMSAMASNLPNQGGYVAKWFTGDNTLSVFAAELKAFAPDFVEFAQKINTDTINIAMVENTANAAKAMSAMASNLPNQGGYVAKWFTGDNTLSTFASELKAFAPDFVEFAQKINTDTINIDMVKNTALAAQAMSAMASNLPNQGGYVAKWFTGDNTLSAFADELVKFAPKFVEFANIFGTVKAETITPGIEAMNTLVNMLKISGKEAMANLGKGFENNKPSALSRIKKVMDDVVKAVSKYQDKMIVPGENVVKGLIKGIRNKESDIKQVTKEVMGGGISGTLAENMDMHSPSRKTEKDGENIMQGLINGIVNKKNELMKTVTTTTDGAFGESSSLTAGLEGLLNSLTSSFDVSGTNAGDAFAAGLGNSGLNGALDGLGKSGEKSAKKVQTAFEKFKEWISDEKFFDRIDTSGEIVAWEKQQKLYKKGSDERKEIDRELYTLRNRYIDETYQNEMDRLADKKFYNKLTTQEEINALEKHKLLYKKDSEQRKEIDKQLYTLKKQLIDETYQKEMDAIAKLNDYGKLSLVEELLRYRTLRTEYAKDSKEREEIDKQIFNLEKKIYETRKKYIDDVKAAQAKADADRLAAQEAYAKTVKDAESEAAEERAEAKKRHDDSVLKAEETANNKRLEAQKKYDDSAQKALEKEAATRIQLEQELADSITSIREQMLADIEAAEKEYADALKSRANTIYGYYGLFDKVAEREVTTPEDLLKNLTDQNAAIEDWRHSLNQLSVRGVSDDMIKELQEMGVSSSGQLSAMLAMTDEQLKEYQDMFNRKHELANTQAMSELENYRKEIDKAIVDLNTKADLDIQNRIDAFNTALAESNATLKLELDESQQIWTDSVNEINLTLFDAMNEAKSIWDTSLTTINTNLQTKLTAATDTLNKTLTDINTNTTEQLKTLKESFDTTMETIHDKTTAQYKAMNTKLRAELKTLNKNTAEEMDTMATTVDTKTEAASTDLTKNIKTGTEESKGVISDFNTSVSSMLSTFEQSLYDIGLNGAKGLANGLRAGKHLVTSAGSAIGQAALTAAKAALDENSPSKEMELVGKFASQGLANGLMKYTNLVSDAGNAVGETSLESIMSSLGDISTLAMMDLDLTPTITPVLNLDSVRRDASILSALMASGQAYDFAATTLSQSEKKATNQNGSVKQGDTNIYNTFRLEGLSVRTEADIDLIATKLYQKQQVNLRGRGTRRGF